MDTISRENNSMLPVGGIVVGVIGLLLGGIALLQIQTVKKTLSEHQAKVDMVDGIKSQAESAAASADKADKNVGALRGETVKAFNDVGEAIGQIRGNMAKMEESLKKPAPAPEVKGGKKGAAGGPVVAGPGEYVVKSGDTGVKIAKANGVSLSDLMTVNPGVNWNKLSSGTKVKLPAKK